MNKENAILPAQELRSLPPEHFWRLRMTGSAVCNI